VKSQTIDPDSVPQAEGGYAQGVRVSGVTDLLLISGQVRLVHDTGPQTPGARPEAEGAT
jgi:enamine deaminase RidA (YjgF/YER057c/UK114 family)